MPDNSERYEGCVLLERMEGNVPGYLSYGAKEGGVASSTALWRLSDSMYAGGPEYLARAGARVGLRPENW